MGEILIHIDKGLITEAFNERANEIGVEFFNVIEDLKEIYSTNITVYTPVGETQNLVANHVIVDTGDYSFFFDNNMMYFPFIIMGTGKHPICPLMPAYSLYWPELGHPLPIGRCVEHPGTAPFDYMEMGFEAADDEVSARLSEFLDWMIRM